MLTSSGSGCAATEMMRSTARSLGQQRQICTLTASRNLGRFPQQARRPLVLRGSELQRRSSPKLQISGAGHRSLALCMHASGGQSQPSPDDLGAAYQPTPALADAIKQRSALPVDVYSRDGGPSTSYGNGAPPGWGSGDGSGGGGGPDHPLTLEGDDDDEGGSASFLPFLLQTAVLLALVFAVARWIGESDKSSGRGAGAQEPKQGLFKRIQSRLGEGRRIRCASRVAGSSAIDGNLGDNICLLLCQMQGCLGGSNSLCCRMRPDAGLVRIALAAVFSAQYTDSAGCKHWPLVDTKASRKMQNAPPHNVDVSMTMHDFMMFHYIKTIGLAQHQPCHQQSQGRSGGAEAAAEGGL